ncbi:MAG: 4Fe-4S dicluster domain-containing protein [Lachnospiraceae bacterium]|nr:4Fe-4S dicluster domain-containing protein [Lachnospiraceae bacterium]
MKIQIQKYDPAVDAAPYYVTGEVPHKEQMTVLEAVTYFTENCEYIAFDYSCHGRQCGRCAVMMDGVPVMMCCTPITDGDHVIEPLKGHPAMRDLIVDKSEYHDRLSREYVRVRVNPLTNEDVDNFGGQDGSQSGTIWALNRCMRCGVCDAACPTKALKPIEFAGPSTMVAIAFRHLDPYDQGDRVMEAVSKGLYHCIQCGMCDSVCQRFEIDHLGVWQILRDAAEARGLKPNYAQ